MTEKRSLIATAKCTDQLHDRDRFSLILGYQLLFIFEGPIATVKCTDQLHARNRFSILLLSVNVTSWLHFTSVSKRYILATFYFCQ
jgi:hypothetical protein